MSRAKINESLGRAASSYARKIIIESSTSLETKVDRIEGIRQKVITMRDAAPYTSKKGLLNLYRPLGYDPEANLMKVKLETTRIQRHEVGNCKEYAYLAVNYLKKQGVKRAEVVYISGDDHVFAVIDRAEGSDINKPDTWGPDAYVCDPWSDNVYSASKFYDNVACYKYYENQENKTYPFKRSKHSLKVEISIGGNDVTSKQKIIQNAIAQLTVIRDTISQLSSPINAQFDAIIKELDETIKNINNESVSIIQDLEISNLAVEHNLAKSIRYLLKKAEATAKTLNVANQLEDNLIRAWVTNSVATYKAEKTPPSVIQFHYWSILLSNDDKVAVPLIEEMGDDVFGRLILSSSYMGSNLLRHVTQHPQMSLESKQKFVKAILTKASSQTLKTIIEQDPPLLVSMNQILGRPYLKAMIDKLSTAELQSILINNQTLLEQAVLADQKDLVEILMDKNYGLNQDNTLMGQYIVQAVNSAVMNGKLDIVKVFFNQFEKINFDFEANNVFEKLLHLAIQSGQANIVQYLLEEKGVDPNHMLGGFTALHVAAGTGKEEILMQLLTKANPNLISATYYTAAGLAHLNGHFHLERILNAHSQETQLFAAAEEGSLEKMEELLIDGDLLTIRPADGLTILGVAIKNGHSELAKLIINYDSKLTDQLIKEATNLAVRYGQAEILRYLLDEKKVDPNVPGFQGIPHLHLAAQAGNEKIVAMLIEKGANPYALNFLGYTAGGSIAALGHHLPVYEWLDKLTEESAFFNAAQLGDVEAFNRLLNKGFDLTKTRKSPWGLSALEIAVLNNQVDFVKRVISQHTSLIPQDMLKTLFLLAFKNASVGVIDYLAENKLIGLDLINEAYNNAYTNFDLPMCQLLSKHFDAAANPSTVSSAFEATAGSSQFEPGITELAKYDPLVQASIDGDLDKLKKLSSEGSDINARGYENNSLLHNASTLGYIDMINYLLDEQKMDPNITNNENSKPIHLAAQFGFQDIVATLIAHGADPAPTNNDENTPEMLAEMAGYPELAAFLKSHSDKLKKPEEEKGNNSTFRRAHAAGITLFTPTTEKEAVDKDLTHQPPGPGSGKGNG